MFPCSYFSIYEILSSFIIFKDCFNCIDNAVIIISEEVTPICMNLESAPTFSAIFVKNAEHRAYFFYLIDSINVES